jgi:hypothetical protein
MRSRVLLGCGAALCVALLYAGASAAQQVYVYPSKGQSPKQQEQDEYQCYEWAKGQTGFDPMQPPQATAPPPSREAPQGGAMRGAARGAAIGAAGGAIGGDAGKGAAIGASTGALMGAYRRRDQQRNEQYAQEQWTQSQAQQVQQGRSQYNRAYKTCLMGRGYSVN